MKKLLLLSLILFSITAYSQYGTAALAGQLAQCINAARNKSNNQNYSETNIPTRSNISNINPAIIEAFYKNISKKYENCINYSTGKYDISIPITANISDGELSKIISEINKQINLENEILYKRRIYDGKVCVAIIVVILLLIGTLIYLMIRCFTKGL